MRRLYYKLFYSIGYAWFYLLPQIEPTINRATRDGFGNAWQKCNMGEEIKQLTFQEELTNLINKHNLERHSNTPDYILAEFMASCLHSFNKATAEREERYIKSNLVSELESAIKKQIDR